MLRKELFLICPNCGCDEFTTSNRMRISLETGRQDLVSVGYACISCNMYISRKEITNNISEFKELALNA
jgi:hypothetical protein